MRINHRSYFHSANVLFLVLLINYKSTLKHLTGKTIEKPKGLSALEETDLSDGPKNNKISEEYQSTPDPATKMSKTSKKSEIRFFRMSERMMSNH